jgi:nucleoporin p58/p45
MGFSGSTFGGGLTMGQPKNPQQQTIPGVKIDVANLRGTTRFNDLHEELQKQIEHMDTVIQGQIKLKNDCNAIMAPHDAQLATVPSDVEFLRRKLVGLESSMAADAEAISHVREFVKADAENAKLSFRAIDNLKLPSQFHVSGVWPAKASSGDGRANNGSDGEVHDIVGFFSSNADELSATLARYRKHITEIEQHLRSVEESSAQQINSLIARRADGSTGEEDDIRQLAFALTDFEQSILHVAGRVGGLREGIQKLQLGNFMGPTNGRSTNGYRNNVY